MDKEFERQKHHAEEKKTFLTFFKNLIQSSKEGTRLQANGKTIHPNTIKTYNTTIKHFIEFTESKGRQIDFENIDLDFYNDYIEFLTKQLKLSPNAIGKDIQIIKLILREALERGLTNNRSFESKRFRVMREQTDSIYLTKDELKELELLDLSNSPKLKIVKDFFLIGCYTGMRYSDFSNI